MSKQVASYRRNQVDGAQPAQILVLLFETAVRRAKVAAQSCCTDKDATRGDAVRRVLDIVIELRSTLDKDAGGDMAGNLDSLYGFVISTVIEAHAARDASKFEQVVEVLVVLRF